MDLLNPGLPRIVLICKWMDVFTRALSRLLPCSLLARMETDEPSSHDKEVEADTEREDDVQLQDSVEVLRLPKDTALERLRTVAGTTFAAIDRVRAEAAAALEDIQTCYKGLEDALRSARERDREHERGPREACVRVSCTHARARVDNDTRRTCTSTLALHSHLAKRAACSRR